MKWKAGGRERSNHMPPKAVETHESHLEELFVAATSSECLVHTAAFNSLSVQHVQRVAVQYTERREHTAVSFKL